jgi:hypothetical protein
MIRTYWGGVRVKAFGPGNSTIVAKKRDGSEMKLIPNQGFLWLASDQEILDAELFDYLGRGLGIFRPSEGCWAVEKPSTPALVRVRYKDGKIEMKKVPLVQ